MKRTPKPKKIRPTCGFPNWRSKPPQAGCDASRRRFLRNFAAGTGFCLVGFPKLSHGQSIEVDLSIVESRALWVEPGYLLLIKWSRPEDDESPIANLEGAADTLQTFLSTRVETVDQLHNLEQLHLLEWEIAEQLGPIVSPAVIDVLHLDHDCSSVCDALEIGLEYPEIYMPNGGPIDIDWD